MTSKLLRDIREEVIGLLFNRYVFRTHQEIARRNPRLQCRPNSIFVEWAWTVYGVANVIGVRRLTGGRYVDSDVNLIKLLDMFIRDPAPLWPCFEQHYPEDAARARAQAVAQAGAPQSHVEILACKRILGQDRKQLLAAADKAIWFASKRVAHAVPDVQVDTTFSDLDEAIDTVTKLTEKYTRIVCAERRRALEPLHRAGDSSVYVLLSTAERNVDLLEEMKRRKLASGWKSIFLEPWATQEIIALDLGEMRPPGAQQ